MEANIYYNPKNQTLFVTSNFDEIQRNMDLGIDPRIDYLKLSVSDIGKFIIKGIGFDKIDNQYFQSIKGILSTHRFEGVAFHHTNIDLSGINIDTDHIVIGDNCNLNLSSLSIKNLNEITFLSLKTFKGTIMDKIDSVKKITLWYTGAKSNTFLSIMPNLEVVEINHGSMISLDLLGNASIRILQLHYCRKLEKVLLNPRHNFEKVIIEGCKNLDLSNLGTNLIKL